MVYSSTMIIICKLLSSHLDKCIVNLGLFSTTNISPGCNRGRARARTGEQLPLLWRHPWAYCALAGRMRTARSFLWLIQFKTKMR